MASVLIVGCGYLGYRLAEHIGKQTVIGLVRSASSCQRLKEAGIEVFQHDLDQFSTGAQLPSAVREVYYFAPPPGRGDTDTRLSSFCSLMTRTGLPKKLLYISTSAVYGDSRGAWIDETAPLQPTTSRGQRRLHAEKILLEWSQKNRVAVVILRVPGIYGPGKLPLERLKKRLPVLRAEESPYTNRIHVSDLVTICHQAMQKGRNREAYNVSDGHPTTMSDYFQQIARRLNLSPLPEVGRAEAEQVLSAGMLSFLNESKRLVNQKMLTELGITLRYPDLESGLDAIFK